MEIFGFHVEREYVRQNGVHGCCDAPSHVCACIGYLAARSRDPTSQSLEPIQSARGEYDRCAAFSEHDRSRLAYSVARSRMLSELAPVMTTTLSLIPCIKFYLL